MKAASGSPGRWSGEDRHLLLHDCRASVSGAIGVSQKRPTIHGIVNEGSYETLFSVFAFVLGAVVGSFLNVCIYRLPLDLSINEPRRSYCPNCKQPIPWYQNLPLISWLVLRGHCANWGNKSRGDYD